VLIDQFIASGEDKWQQHSGVVLLLPHGFEGQGPEHSSARPERFLQLCAEENMQVVIPTTPAQYFHVLRRQAIRPWRKPLVVMTPKSLLRHPAAVSSHDEFTGGRFARIVADDSVGGDVGRIVLCTGKVYYDLAEHRDECGNREVAIIRLEQLYPLTPESVNAALAQYPDNTPVVWVQEEPENMGAWGYLVRTIGPQLQRGMTFSGITREASASPATGSASMHRLEQKQLVAEACSELGPDRQTNEATEGESN
jgi:2-oxoglutarate dehydrogenase E1 component